VTEFNARITPVLARRDWQLAQPELNDGAWSALVADVERLMAESQDRRRQAGERLDRAVIFAYCPILLAACREEGSPRQRRAFEELWRWIYPRVYVRIDQAQDAQDVAQQVMLKVYQNLHQVAHPHGFLGWVSAIIRREVGEHFRRQNRMNQFEQGMPPDGDNGGGDGTDDLTGPDPFLEAEDRLAEEALVAMIMDCLPKEQRRRAEVLVALALKGRTTKEVAEALQTTPTNVNLIYFRAKRDLLKHCRRVIDALLEHLAPSRQAAVMKRDS
jgi:RNA polymerase sigma factor (sigma-70 family)